MPLQLDGFEQLQSAHHLQLLNVIDELRAQGLSQFFPLPQLIVCGDQSSGKSSVLEAISGVPFPKKDQLCTRFATEVILRRNDALDDVQATVSINPGLSARSSEESEKVASFHQLIKDMSELPDVISRAQDAMGLGPSGNAFSADVLRLEVTGPRIPQLTIVDLPGLIHSENRMQTTQDVHLVAELVGNYMKQERSIILAVVSAKNDYANQIILKKARDTDPLGERTLGIITKPDTLYPGSDSESAFLDLAQNKDVKFSLGWHVLRNPDSNESKSADRATLEAEFFAGSRWSMLPPHGRGVDALRERLGQILFAQIKRELPSLARDIKNGAEQCTRDLNKLGRERQTEVEQRLYLGDIAQDFHNICQAACDGKYRLPFFTGGSDNDKVTKRLCANIRNANMNFAFEMFKRGSKYPLPSAAADKRADDPAYKEAVKRATALVKQNRARELNGMFNSHVVGDLFREYASPWPKRATDHVHLVWKKIRLFVAAVLHEIADVDVRDACLRLILEPQLDKLLQQALKVTQQIASVTGSDPSTYNAEFLKAYQKQKNQCLADKITKQITSQSLNRSTVEISRISSGITALLDEEIEDMDKVAGRDAVDYTLAYYEIAVKRFVDEIPIYVVDKVLMEQLPSIFNAKTVLSFRADQVSEIAAESSSKQQARAQLTERLKLLQSCEATCKRFSSTLMDDVYKTATDGVVTPSHQDSNDHELREVNAPKATTPIFQLAAAAATRERNTPAQVNENAASVDRSRPLETTSDNKAAPNGTTKARPASNSDWHSNVFNFNEKPKGEPSLFRTPSPFLEPVRGSGSFQAPPSLSPDTGKFFPLSSSKPV